jgi:2-iminobutanoate/2-iminopropanoate deaminase
MKKVIATDQAPAALGPYSQAVAAKCGQLVFCSGQIGIDPATGELVSADVAEQTRRVMENLQAILASAGTDFDAVVKTTLFLADIADFAAANEVYAGFFAKNPPARATVECSALPKGARVEIDAVAVIG